ncbi:uncharacterized protein Nmag_4285 (plasmid) [Natrialba magadii ATCC 43099]|uniref:Uncharacterized protein n=2 Tax=root TaxID=1 RepID=D3T2I4_NATMM|nr:hypothetical protein [Natrialba magadii]YP_010078063.1 uncharacterized protein KMC42_gp33 [Natrialba phage PhiCh1]ADD07793.1 uncharacterized protein Nmag_4285 [Natrialba magadii ATCC 43099]ELY23038.1 hypothetical protein C500_21280 [Natrialba magadii ATCC 43099]QBJ01214.1 uncharacterized protein PhiCh1_160 [Natrialba phage PhiCh1]
MQLIFTPDDSGTNRASGYATVPYSSDSEEETVAEITEDVLASVFQEAQDNGATLKGADESIDTAVDDPLSYRDYLILRDGEIVFDESYSRNQNEG